MGILNQKETIKKVDILACQFT